MNKRILTYLNELEPPIDIQLPGKNVQWLHPHKNPETCRCTEEFYSKYYSDRTERILVLGINPGRFGSGITGVPLTDPIRLKTVCNIDSNFPLKPELSSKFIYDHFFTEYSMNEFYDKFFIGAVCPLGLESNGRNMNYYDNKIFMNELLEYFIPDSIEKQINLGCSRKVAICLGEGVNYSILNKLNTKHQFFEKILKISHPRFIMQYKRKTINDYVKQYIDACRLAEKLVSN
ncbi:unnamed protein product [Rotaria socialis]|uniref:Uracil-DNA glycosylase-like domain-containing protein n=1 Tax=Rotaria socialis TaxID=392032 RepID=A0A817KWW3_9BILA|nr:unnamed protein product [Rotaria socialis]CAF3326673.1 unnamed protein product [Rotaria socialis]CAF3374787.1 unnamed protein product [Rotaria socialis]CAF3617735.1 unnamed protein product [Rotaria socialis]CAF3637886.1 unnamed protein product [Rotaria socialis]